MRFVNDSSIASLDGDCLSHEECRTRPPKARLMVWRS